MRIKIALSLLFCAFCATFQPLYAGSFWSAPAPAKLGPAHFHTIHLISGAKDSIETDDGTYWHISSHDAQKLSTWRKGDLFIITPNASVISHHRYILNNQRNGQKIEANIHLGPTPKNNHTHWVITIDWAASRIYFENGMLWEVSAADSAKFLEWQVGDYAVIGTNDSLISSHEHILINVNRNRHLRTNLIR